MNATLRLTPRGHLKFEEASDAPPIPDIIGTWCSVAFSRGEGHGLVVRGIGEGTEALKDLLFFLEN